jgi:cell division protein FtsL
MVPLSLGRTSTLGPQRRSLPGRLAWLRPANVAAASQSERRAVSTWTGIFMIALVAVALGHVWLRLQVRDLGYQLSTARQVIDRLEQEEHELDAEAARLDAPGRIATVARSRLGMQYPGSAQEARLP